MRLNCHLKTIWNLSRAPISLLIIPSQNNNPTPCSQICLLLCFLPLATQLLLYMSIESRIAFVGGKNTLKKKITLSVFYVGHFIHLWMHLKRLCDLSQTWYIVLFETYLLPQYLKVSMLKSVHLGNTGWHDKVLDEFLHNFVVIADRFAVSSFLLFPSSENVNYLCQISFENHFKSLNLQCAINLTL